MSCKHVLLSCDPTAYYNNGNAESLNKIYLFCSLNLENKFYLDTASQTAPGCQAEKNDQGKRSNYGCVDKSCPVNPRTTVVVQF